jgi:hypothetical protein
VARVAIPSARSSVLDTPDGLIINIPAPRTWYAILFLGFWLCGWAFGEVAVIRELVIGKFKGSSLFLIGWLGAWTVGGAAAIYFWSWMIAGHEIVSLTPTLLGVRRDILGFGRSREYDLPSVKNLRIDRAPIYNNLSSTNLSRSMFGSTIAFDYGAKTFRFGGGIDEAEASQLIERLKARYPFESGSQ